VTCVKYNYRLKYDLTK